MMVELFRSSEGEQTNETLVRFVLFSSPDKSSFFIKPVPQSTQNRQLTLNSGMFFGVITSEYLDQISPVAVSAMLCETLTCSTGLVRSLSPAITSDLESNTTVLVANSGDTVLVKRPPRLVETVWESGLPFPGGRPKEHGLWSGWMLP